jgi:hypothetical protein
MLKWIAFLCSLLLALNLGTIAEVLRADVPDQDGSESDVIAKPVSPSGAMRQSSNGVSNSLYAHSCEELWYQRNAILWSAGYCFHATGAVRIFGNTACGYHRTYELPLTARDFQLVSLLELAEAAKECQLDK